jgi:hypothetical protein
MPVGQRTARAGSAIYSHRITNNRLFPRATRCGKNAETSEDTVFALSSGVSRRSVLDSYYTSFGTSYGLRYSRLRSLSASGSLTNRSVLGSRCTLRPSLQEILARWQTLAER